MARWRHFTEWRGVKLLGALSQGMYWFLVMRADLGIARGDLAALRGKRIGAAPWVEMGLRALLTRRVLIPTARASASARSRAPPAARSISG